MIKATASKKTLPYFLAAFVVFAAVPIAAAASAARAEGAKFELMYDSNEAAMGQLDGIAGQLAEREAVAAAAGQEKPENGAGQKRKATQIEGAKARLKAGIAKAYLAEGAAGLEVLGLPAEAKARAERAFEDAKETKYIIKYSSPGNDIKGIVAGYAALKSSRAESGFEMIELSEGANPKELAASLRAGGAGSLIEYIVPDTCVHFSSQSEEWPESEGPLLGEGAAPPELLGEEVVVAMIDTLVDTGHEALQGHLAEGWNFIDGTSGVDCGGSPEGSHSTHLSGIVAQASAGRNVKVMPLVVFEDGYARTSDIISAIAYAEANGASIVNMSWGCSTPNPVLREAMENSGLLFIAAAGNSRSDLSEPGAQAYPACFSGLGNLISVGALNGDSGSSFFTNYGNPVDVGALGRDVRSALPGGGYGIQSGTSMSAAMVSAAAAAVLSQEGGLSAAELKSRIIKTADKMSHLQGKVKDGRRLSLDNALAGIEQEETIEASYADDFDPCGYSPIPMEQYGLFSGGGGAAGAAAGECHSLALMSNGTVWGFGQNGDGEVGSGCQGGTSPPVQAVGLANIESVAARGSHSMALAQNGRVSTWGSNAYYQLGEPYRENTSVPLEIPTLYDVVKIAAGERHSLAVDANGKLWAWGDSFYGQAGYGPKNDPWRPWPMLMEELEGVEIVDAAAGAHHSVALSSDGRVWAWGRNDHGQLGDGTSADSACPLEVQGLSGIVAVSAGENHSMALDSQGRIWVFGDNSLGQLGAGASSASAPVELETLGGADGVSAGGAHSLAVESGSLWAWGCNSDGQLGDGACLDINEPAQVPGMAGTASAAAGARHSLSVKADGSLWAFGSNFFGQLGDGSFDDSCVPVLVWGPAQPAEAECVAFEEESYEAFIPSPGKTATIPVSAKACDASGNAAVPAPPVAYALGAPYAGVSVDASTGAVTVTSAAQEGVATVRAVCGQLDEAADLILNSYVKLESEIEISAELGGEYPIELSARYISKYNWIGLVIEYDALVFSVSSIDAPQSVEVTQPFPGEARFVTDVRASDGAVPLLTLKAKAAGSSAVRISSE